MWRRGEWGPEDPIISYVDSGLKLASTRQKRNVDLILCHREPGVGEIIVDEAEYEDGQKVENRVTKKLTSGSLSQLTRGARW
jgi:hypothetical protein